MIRLLAQDDAGTLRPDCICSENSTTWQFFSFSFLRLICLLMCVWIVCLHLYLCAMRIPVAYGQQKRISEPLEYKLQKTLRHRVSPGN